MKKFWDGLRNIPVVSIGLVFAIIAANIAFVFFTPELCRLIRLDPEKSGFLVSVYEALCAALSSVFLLLGMRGRQPNPPWLKILVLAFFMLAFGDFFYGFDYYLLGHIYKNHLLMLTHELPYLVFMASLGIAAFLRGKESLDRTFMRRVVGSIALIGFIYFIWSYKVVLSFQFPVGYDRPWLNVFTSYAYGILQSFTVGALLIASVRTRSVSEFLMWLFFLTLNASDFALRYQDVGQRPLGIPVFEHGWSIAISMLLINSIWIHVNSIRKKSVLCMTPAPLNHVRVLVPALMVSALLTFACINLLVSPYLRLADASTVAGYALVFAFFWVTSNVAGVYLSRSVLERASEMGESITFGRFDPACFESELIEFQPVVSALSKVVINKNRETADLVSSQAGHDIRSPLAVIETALQGIGAIPDENRTLIRSAVLTIKGIADHLLQKTPREAWSTEDGQTGVHSSEARIQCHVPGLVGLVLAEKRMEFRSRSGIEIRMVTDSESYRAFAFIPPVEMKRMISNLVNNAVEAIPDSGSVEVAVKLNGERLEITVSDNGVGIPEEIRNELGKIGASYGKTTGSGFGLFHAINSVRAWQGEVQIESKIGAGTSVRITLPLAPFPSWSIPAISIPQGMAVVVADDDERIHALWEERLREARSGVEILHFSGMNQLRKWFQDSGSKKTCFLFIIDFDLKNENETAIDLIRSLGIASRSILVSSRHDDQSLIDSCLEIGVKVIPESMIEQIPISCGSLPVSVDAVLLDDDELVHLVWDAVARRSGGNLIHYYEPEKFLDGIESLDRKSIIFLDAHLGNGVSGEGLVPKIHEMGFEKIYITTGYEAERFDRISGLSGVVGKEPPECLSI